MNNGLIKIIDGLCGIILILSVVLTLTGQFWMAAATCGAALFTLWVSSNEK